MRSKRENNKKSPVRKPSLIPENKRPAPRTKNVENIPNVPTTAIWTNLGLVILINSENKSPVIPENKVNSPNFK